jgi:hypothetical protein
LTAQLLENFELFAPVLVLQSNICYDRPHPVDVVSHHDTAERLDKDHTNCFFVIDWHDITETDSEHDVCRPVIRPNISFDPGSIYYPLFDYPVVGRAECCHSCQKKSYQMSEAKIDQKNLYHLPILLVINISYKVNLQFLNFIQALRQFKDDKHPEIGDSSLLG